jgi:hypothetical protein
MDRSTPPSTIGPGSPDVSQQVLFQVLLLWLLTIGLAMLLAGQRGASSSGWSRRSVSRMTAATGDGPGMHASNGLAADDATVARGAR